MRGVFVLGDGTEIPNNVTIVGRQSVLAAAFLNTYTPLYLGLCVGEYADDLTIAALTEPTIGLGGYQRKPLTRDSTTWVSSGLVNNEPYIESDWLEFVATGDGFDEEIDRMFICWSLNATDADVFALSGVKPTPIRILATTPQADRRFKYRFYSR